MDIIEISTNLEANKDIHLARLLILLNVFTANGDTLLEGLTKLAKLDFLLRYPVYLERALEAKNKNPKNMNVADYERKTVESKMIRYRYGPWDPKYREFINILIGKGLLFYKQNGNTINIGMTEAGISIAIKLLDLEDFKLYETRSKILKQNFDFKGTHLMKFIYKTFPEIGSLQIGKDITYEN